MYRRFLFCAVMAALVVGCNQGANRAPAPKIQLVCFGASWCAPCKQKAPAIDAIIRDAKGKVQKVYVDVDQQPGVADSYGIRAVPTYVVLVNGREVFRSGDPSQIRARLGLGG
jgi:thioredoxin-like negative regulator of GroEL